MKVLPEFQRLGKVHYAQACTNPPPPGRSGRRTVSDIFFKDTSRRLYRMFQSVRNQNAILITAQEVGFQALLRARQERLFGAVGWWCFGTPHLYSSVRSLRNAPAKSARIGLELLAILSPLVNRQFWKLRNLDFVIAGTRWLCDLLNYFAEIDPLGFVYPPTDTAKFSPRLPRVPNGTYAFSLGDVKDVRLDILEALSHKVPMVRAGRPILSRAKNLPNAVDLDLIELYASATFTAYPTNLEQFGLPVAESLACGTPVLTFPWQGPGEVVTEGITGWKATDASDFVNIATGICHDGYDEGIRENCRRFAEEHLSIEACTETFVGLMDKIGM